MFNCAKFKRPVPFECPNCGGRYLLPGWPLTNGVYGNIMYNELTAWGKPRPCPECGFMMVIKIELSAVVTGIDGPVEKLKVVDGGHKGRPSRSRARVKLI